ncbi:MAG: hypothetical protein KKE44_19230 [Proteobacteria bacterium]|nr:hypothetical protein [Pseudomonadota bacterium]MBU1584867.1 hypothetical protein [Pseudomonadota bacterium]MBU2628759.1 hypothetical protein [Pseudomonadota bacterium]
MSVNVKYYAVAGITIQVNSDLPITENTFHPRFKLFEVDGPGVDNVVIHHHFYLPDPLLKNHDSQKNEIYKKDQWQIYKTNDAWIYKFHPVFPDDPDHSAVGIFNLNHRHVDIYTCDIDKVKYANHHFNALTLFNSDQVLFSKILSDRNGLIIHSNGFDMDGNGILLAGRSGAGKSTLSKMLKADNMKILCDDRMFIARPGTDFWIYGNWCHGSVPDISQGSAPLKAIFFLKQSKTNQIVLFKDVSALIPLLMKSIVKPFLDKEGWDKTLTTIKDLIETIPCYQLEFDLSGNICKNIRNLIN